MDRGSRKSQHPAGLGGRMFEQQENQLPVRSAERGGDPFNVGVELLYLDFGIDCSEIGPIQGDKRG